MDRKAAKELLHIQDWLERVDEILERGKNAYLADDLLQEAGDSLMMKLGDAASRLSPNSVCSLPRGSSGPSRREQELHHPPVRPDQPRDHMADPLGRPARVEGLACVAL